MKARFFASVLAAAGLAGCATDYVPPPPSAEPGPAHDREIREGRPGIFGDLRWTVDLKTGERIPNDPVPDSAKPASNAEQQEFQKWRESAGSQERQEFEEWRAWQEWKRKNPK